MAAVAWTAIGLLAATVFGVLYYLGGRIDSLAGRIDHLDSSLNGRIDHLDSSLNGRIDALDARLSARLDGLAVRIDAHVERHAG